MVPHPVVTGGAPPSTRKDLKPVEVSWGGDRVPPSPPPPPPRCKQTPVKTTFPILRMRLVITFPLYLVRGRYQNWLDCSGLPRHRENREFESPFFQTGKTQGIC